MTMSLTVADILGMNWSIVVDSLVVCFPFLILGFSSPQSYDYLAELESVLFVSEIPEELKKASSKEDELCSSSSFTILQ